MQDGFLGLVHLSHMKNKVSSVKINIKADCGNSPKRESLKDFNVAIVRRDWDFIMNHTHEEIYWRMYGELEIEGKEAFSKTIRKISDDLPREITLYHIITHGKEGTVHGEMSFEDGKKVAFWDVYEFVSAGKNQIKKMYSFVRTISE